MSTEDINALSPLEIFSLDALSGQTTLADCLSLGVKTRRDSMQWRPLFTVCFNQPRWSRTLTYAYMGRDR